jgi:hypothetical protein
MRNTKITLQLLFVTVALGLLAACGTTLAPGGAYSDVNLAQTDQAILDANGAMDGFVQWEAANHTFLLKYQEVGALAAIITAQKGGWVKEAYAARDAYASASQAYKAAIAAGKTADPTGQNAAHDKLIAALAVLTDVTKQVVAYRAAHPPTA